MLTTIVLTLGPVQFPIKLFGSKREGMGEKNQPRKINRRGEQQITIFLTKLNKKTKTLSVF